MREGLRGAAHLLPPQRSPHPALRAQCRRELVHRVIGRHHLAKYRAVLPTERNGALHKAIDYTLSKNAVAYRPASAVDYRLSQVADYICTAELAALKYQGKASTATDEKFFGSWLQFKKGVLKEVRAKHM